MNSIEDSRQILAQWACHILNGTECFGLISHHSASGPGGTWRALGASRAQLALAHVFVIFSLTVNQVFTEYENSTSYW